MSAAVVVAALLRTTVAASVACAAAWVLLAALRVQSPRVHRVVWTLAVLQGWVFLSWTVRVTVPDDSGFKSGGDQAIGAVTSGSAMITPVGGPQDVAAARSPAADIRVAAKRVQWVVAAAWGCGVVLVCVMGVWRYGRVLRALPLGAAPERKSWRREWRREVRAAGLKRRTRVHLRMTDELGPLLYWAPWSYLVLAPRGLWLALSGAERRSILRHELAHLRRRDLQKSLAIRFVALPQWFNPLVRLAVRRFDEAGEWACDEAAGMNPAARLAFARVLLRAAEGVVNRKALPGAQALRGGVLGRRVRRLVNPRFKEESVMKKFFVPSVLVVVAVVQGVRIQPISGEEIEHVGGAWAQPYQDGSPRAKAAEPARNESAEKRSSLDDYVIEPPDVLTLTMVGGEFRSHDVNDIRKRFKGFYQDLDKDGLGARRLVVAADGTVQLPLLGAIHVDGKTVKEAREEIETQLKRFIVEPSVRITVAEFNSKVAYVILEGGPNGDEVIRVKLPYPLTAEINVGSVLKDFRLPYPLNIGSGQLSLKRPAFDDKEKEKILLIEWDRTEGKPTDRTNYPVLPGDRICIRPVRFSQEPTPAAVLASEQDKPKILSDESFIQLRIAVVEDAEGTLAEIGELKQSGAMLGDSSMALGLLKILQKHKLVTKTADPQLRCRIGEPASLEIADAGDAESGVRVSVDSRRLDKSRLTLEVAVREGSDERRGGVTLSIEDRKTIIMKLEAREGSDAKKKKSGPARYVFVTPEVSDGPMVYSWSLAK